MTRIRILLAELPRMLQEIVQTVVAAQPDLEIAGTVDHRDLLPEAVSRTGAEVVIVGLTRGETAEGYDTLLFAHPQVKLFAVAADGRRAFLYELRPRSVPLGDVSPEELVAAIRSAAHTSNEC